MVKPKKHLGQHFLKDAFVAQRIADSLQGSGYTQVVEIGPGTGVLTQFLLQRSEKIWLVEIDSESVSYLQRHFPLEQGQLIEGDFLRLPIEQVFPEPFALIGNYPYNISSQIIFKALEHRDQIPEIGGMFQKEVAERLVAGPGSKTYGIISVFCALWYEREYLFTVEPEVFNPPPKVKSGVIRMRRRDLVETPFDEKLLRSVVKMAFNQRRKTLRNALKSLTLEPSERLADLLNQRAEQLTPQDFVFLTNSVVSNEL
jgi:16S rRNA (adenine1518-N6/adenine1519-N6)-dimethyltransferase